MRLLLNYIIIVELPSSREINNTYLSRYQYSLIDFPWRVNQASIVNQAIGKPVTCSSLYHTAYSKYGLGSSLKPILD